MFCLNVIGENVLHKVTIVAIACILIACSSPRTTTSIATFDSVTQPAGYYLQQMQQHSGETRTNWQLLAVRALINEGNYSQAQRQLQQLPPTLNPAQYQEQQLIIAQLSLLNKQPAASLIALARVNVATLSPQQQQRYFRMVVAANQGRPSMELLRAYIALEPMAKGIERQKNIDATWQTLLKMSRQQLSSASVEQREITLQGWFDLLSLYRANVGDSDMLRSALQDWRAHYPQHPAAATPPTLLTSSPQMTTASTNFVALLLPLSGQAKVFSAGIQRGFDDARQLGEMPPPSLQQPGNATLGNMAVADIIDSLSGEVDEQPHPTASSEATDSLQVKVYDTTNQSMEQLLQRVQREGATLVVGPLLKSNVQQVIASPTALNVLALNQPEMRQVRPNICFFALSPEDEARSAAQHIWQQGQRRPLLLVPGGELGDRIGESFTRTWQQQGGMTVLRQRFNGTAQLQQMLNSRSGFSLNGTPVGVRSAQVPDVDQPAAALTSAAAANSSAIDAIYIVANAKELQLIKPMIAMRVGSRSKLALYASSRSIQGNVGADFRIEMDGLQFSDIPLLSGQNPLLLRRAMSHFGNDFAQIRLYAMGYDAWMLANHFNQLRDQAGFGLQGNTGLLHVSNDCVINRELQWNQFQQGKVVPLE